MINISNLYKPRVFQELYNNALFMGDSPINNEISLEFCEKIVAEFLVFDIFCGKMLNIDLTDDCFDEREYDSVNGIGKAKEIIDKLRERERLERPRVLIYPIEYKERYTGIYCDEYTGIVSSNLEDFNYMKTMPTPKMEVVCRGIDIRTDEEITVSTTYFAGVMSIDAFDPLLIDNDIVFLDKRNDVMDNEIIIFENRITYDEVKEEYEKLKLAGVYESQINRLLLNKYCGRNKKR